MREIPVGGTVEFDNILYPQRLQQVGDNDTSHRIDTVDGYRKVSSPNSLDIDQIQSQYTLDMFLCIGVVLIQMPQRIELGKLEGFCFGNAQHLLPLGSIQKFAFLIQQFQGIPLLGIVTGSQYDSATSMLLGHGNFGGRGCSQSYIHHIESHTHEGSDYGMFHHFARDAGIASHHNLVGLDRRIFTNKGSIRCRKLDNIERIEALTHFSTDSTSNA